MFHPFDIHQENSFQTHDPSFSLYRKMFYNFHMQSSLPSSHSLSSNIICQFCDVLGHPAGQCQELFVSLSTRYGPVILETNNSSTRCSSLVPLTDGPSLSTDKVGATTVALKSTSLSKRVAHEVQCSSLIDTSADWPTLEQATSTWDDTPSDIPSLSLESATEAASRQSSSSSKNSATTDPSTTPYFHLPPNHGYLSAQSSRLSQNPQFFPHTLSSGSITSRCDDSLSSDEDDSPPNQLFQPLSSFQSRQTNLISSSMAIQVPSPAKKPCRIAFSSRDEEIQYLKKLMVNCEMYDGNPEQLITWLIETNAFIVKEGYPEIYHPYIIRHLLLDDALTYYLVHDDLIFNFYDLCKLFLHRHSILAQSSQSSQIPQNFPLTFSSDPLKSHCENSKPPAGTKSWDSSSLLTSQQSHPFLSPDHFHSQHERDYLLAKAISSSSSGCKLVSTPSTTTLPCTEVASLWPDGATSWFPDPLPPRPQLFSLPLSFGTVEFQCGSSNCSAESKTWHSSGPVPSRQSRPIITSHHFYSQHEKDYVLTKSLSSLSSGSTLVSTLSKDTLQCTEVESIWPEGSTSWFSDPLSPRSPPVSSDDAVSTSPKTLYSSVPEQETTLMFPSAPSIVFSPISQMARFARVSVLSRHRHLRNPLFSHRKFSSASLFPSQRHSLQVLFSVLLSALISLILFTLTFVQFNFNNERRVVTLDLHPARQLWHVMVP